MVCRETVQHTCGQRFCRDCCEEWESQPNTCACCRQEGVVAPDFRSRREIKALLISCSKRCGQTFRLQDKEKHLSKICDKREVPCPDCKAQVVLSGMPDHRTFTCPYRLVPCGICEDLVEFREKERHSKQCAFDKCAEQTIENKILVERNTFLEKENARLRALLENSLTMRSSENEDGFDDSDNDTDSSDEDFVGSIMEELD